MCTRADMYTYMQASTAQLLTQFLRLQRNVLETLKEPIRRKSKKVGDKYVEKALRVPR